MQPSERVGLLKERMCRFVRRGQEHNALRVLRDPVYAGDRLVEVLLPGATFDVASPVTGRLAEKCAGPDEPLTPGQVLGVVEEADEE